MDAAHDNRRQLGRLMVDEGFLSEEQLALALAQQSETGRPLGTILVELGFVSAGAVGNALAEQHGGLLKTEFGISAGLHTVNGGTSAPAPAPAPVAAPDVGTGPGTVPVLAPVAAPPERAQPEPVAPDPLAARAHELELQLNVMISERNAFAQSVNDLQAALNAATQGHEAQVAHATADATAWVAALESELQAALGARKEVETAVRLGAARIAELQREVTELREQAAQVAEANTVPEPPAETAHLLLRPSPSGYTLLEWPGPAPASGTLLDVDGVDFVARRIGVSPFPGSRLRCVFLECL